MEQIIKDRLNKYFELIDSFFETIKKYDRIAIFRHEKPDFDAVGTQMGLYHFIRDNFPNKEVIYVGDDLVGNNDCFPKMMTVDDSWYDEEFLAVILDLSNFDRIACEKANKAKEIVKIDHHPVVEHFGNIEIVDESMIAAGELLASILFSKENEYKISAECASNLYKAVVGDSGRFLFSSTSVHTFLIAQKLLQTGFNLNEVYHQMYDDNLSKLKVKTYILKHYKITKNGIAYYVLKDKTLKRFGLLPVQGKDNINTFAHFEGINAWLSITEDKSKGRWRVSIRSGKEPIDHIAVKYGGGGHAQASATKLKTLREVKALIAELDLMFAK